jgi:plastocyanin
LDTGGPDQAARSPGGASPVCLRRRLGVIWVVLIVAAFAGVVVKSDAAAAASAVVRVSITEQGFSPAVVVIPTGTVVRWQNNGTLAHSLSGQVRSPSDLQPGETYQRRFTTPGQYSYLDGRHHDSGGTVVVVAGSSRPPHAHGNATYHYSARLKLSVDDQWTYYDSQWDSKSGPCDAQIGSGTRLIHLDVRFPNVTYDRVPSIGVEALTSPEVRGRFGDSGETIKSQIAGNSSPDVTCPDGSTGPTANQPANCYRSFTGKPVSLSLDWGPTVTKNRFLITNDGPMIVPGSCGSQIVGALVLVGVKKPVLPLNLVGYRVNYDEAQTNAATSAEVRAIRAGRPFTVNRRVDLNFTTDCCEGWAPAGGIWARTGNIHRYIASLTISFKPRG